VPTLHLGVTVVPYRRRGLTTGDVATFLEHRYGVMGAFVRVHEKDIASAVESSLEGALESLLMKQYVDPWARGMSKIGQEFRDFISSREAERVGIPGTPTRAALMGVNHRLAHPYAKGNMRRPSFRDTGMYTNSARAWITGV
jgi:hypothetical protein